MRSVAAMAAQPFVDYYEHTLSHEFLRQQAYPFVREVALFYASYLELNAATGQYEVPHACAQEFCGERQLPAVPFTNSPSYPGKGCPQPPQKSPTIDLAFAAYVFDKAVQWALLLGVDEIDRLKWAAISAALQPYPVATHPDCDKLFPWARGNCTGWSEAIDMRGNSPANITANTNWPIANFAPIHPTGQISLSSDPATLKLARTTVWMLNSHSDWAPVNGFCLAW